MIRAPATAPMPTPAPPIVLRRVPTPAQARVLELLAEAPGYKQIAHALGISKRTVRLYVSELAELLPLDFAPDGQPKERVILYAMRAWATREIARDRERREPPREHAA